MKWPDTFDQLVQDQIRLGKTEVPSWRPKSALYSIGGCFICFPRGQSGYGDRGDPAWAGAACIRTDGRVDTAGTSGTAGARYEAGLLALREGPLLESAVRALPKRPEILLVNATGHDHTRRAGLAIHLGAMLSVPTVGVTHRPLIGRGDWPESVRGASSPIHVHDDLVGYWVCTRTGTRPLVIHAGWQTDPETAKEVVLSTVSGEARTPEPLRRAREVARTARTAA